MVWGSFYDTIPITLPTNTSVPTPIPTIPDQEWSLRSTG